MIQMLKRNITNKTQNVKVIFARVPNKKYYEDYQNIEKNLRKPSSITLN